MLQYLSLGALVFVLAAVACGSKATAKPSTTTAPSNFTGVLTGTLKAPDCGGGYNLTGAAVTVRDEHDTIVGSSTADTGPDPNASPVWHEVSPGHQVKDPGGCIATFTVSHLPRAKFYQVTVGSHGGPAHSFDELQSAGWHLDLTLN